MCLKDQGLEPQHQGVLGVGIVLYILTASFIYRADCHESYGVDDDKAAEVSCLTFC